MTTPVWFGDIPISILTDKDTSIEKEVVEKNFVDSPPQVFEVDVGLESGTYNAVHNEKLHPRDEGLDEQIDAVQSMVARHAAELPFELSGDKGHVMIESATSDITPSKEFRESSIDIRFFSETSYKPAFSLSADRHNDSFDTEPLESLLALSGQVENVEDSDGNSVSSEFSLDGESGSFDYYLYDDSREVISYDRNPSDYTSDERINPVRLYNGSDRRIYSDSKALHESSRLENGLVRLSFDSSESYLLIYDDEDWKEIGNLNFTLEDGYSSENTSHKIDVETVEEHKASLFRGFTVFELELDGVSEFRFDTDDSLSTGDTSNSWYRTVENGDGDEIILIRTSTDGSFDDTDSYLEVGGLTDSDTYTFYLGIVPADVDSEDYARYVYNIGRQNQTMIQR